MTVLRIKTPTEQKVMYPGLTVNQLWYFSHLVDGNEDEEGKDEPANNEEEGSDLDASGWVDALLSDGLPHSYGICDDVDDTDHLKIQREIFSLSSRTLKFGDDLCSTDSTDSNNQLLHKTMITTFARHREVIKAKLSTNFF